MRVLITGAGGLIGAHLVRRLSEVGMEVRAMLRPGRSLNSRAAKFAEVVHGDIRDFHAVERCMVGCHQVFHLAAEVSHTADRAALFATNVTGSANLARAAVKSGVGRFIYTSTAAIYGRTVSRHALTEQSAPQPDSAYGASKWAAEELLRTAQRQEGLPVVIVRTSNVLGAGERAWLNLHKSVASGKFRLLGRGNGLHTLTAIEDFLDGLLLCATKKAIEGRTYLITGARAITLREWLDMIAEETGAPRPRSGFPQWPLRLYHQADALSARWTGRHLPNADRLSLFLGDRSFDISRARQELGYAPKLTPRETIRSLLKWYRSQGWLPAP